MLGCVSFFARNASFRKSERKSALSPEARSRGS